MTIFFVHIWTQEYSWQWGIKKGWDGTAGWVIERLNVGVSQGLGLKWARPENTSTRLTGSGATAARYEGKVICMRYDGFSTNLKYFANGRFIKESNETQDQHERKDKGEIWSCINLHGIDIQGWVPRLILV